MLNTIRRGLDTFTDTSRSSLIADYVYNDAGGVFTDYTAAAGNTTASDVVITRGPSHYLYIGADVMFGTLFIDVITTVPSGTRQLEYWNGSAWTVIPAASGATAGETGPTYNIITGNINLSFRRVIYASTQNDSSCS